MPNLSTSPTRQQPQEAIRYADWHLRAIRHVQPEKNQGSPLGLAQAVVAHALCTFWHLKTAQYSLDWDLLPPTQPLPALSPAGESIAQGLGLCLSEQAAADVPYLLGTTYTCMLPATVRSATGAFYTPPPLVHRLLDQVQLAGVDWQCHSVLDPSCGSGAFLVPTALRMLPLVNKSDPERALQLLARRLRGWELDPFSAWMAQVLLEINLLPLCACASSRLPPCITVTDSLKPPAALSLERFDLVIGNPPYGRVALEPATRSRFARSLHGHANLYGLFFDLALQQLAHNGVIGYVTPTSYLSGQYFKALRSLLLQETFPFSFDFIDSRKNVFDQVLQETMLSVYKSAPQHTASAQEGQPATQPHFTTIQLTPPLTAIHRLITKNSTLQPVSVGTSDIASQKGPWLIARSAAGLPLTRAAAQMPTRLRHLGIQVATGPLVWNRHKPQLRTQPEPNSYPLIWANSVCAHGLVFDDSRQPASHILIQNQNHLITKKTCILLRRTTATEQARRLVCTVLPQPLIDRHGGVVVENHLNMLHASCTESSETAPFGALSAILNSAVLDQLFRCLSGSVAISAYELESLPMPSLAQILLVENLLQSNPTPEQINALVASFYA